MALLREGHDHGAVLERSVVLDAMGIAHEVQPTPDGRWALVVDDVDSPAAEAALAAWEAENPRRPELLARPDYGRSLAGVAAGLAILAFTVHVGVRPAGSLVERGSADAARMLQGEWWRAATALTLHADLAHVAANAVAISIFLGAVARRLGPALATWLALVAGIVGNVLTALVLRGDHVSIGASTAVFGALGTLSALQVPRRGAWLTLGVGVALLGFLGTGARTDLLAAPLRLRCWRDGGAGPTPHDPAAALASPAGHRAPGRRAHHARLVASARAVSAVHSIRRRPRRRIACWRPTDAPVFAHLSRRLTSSVKKAFSRGKGAASARAWKVPGPAISSAARRNAPQAARARAAPTLMRRTP